MSSPFDFVNSVTKKDEYLYSDEATFRKEYASFIVNRALSNDIKCCMFADALNCYPELDLKLQYDFYYYGLPKMRTGKMWTKKEESDLDMESIKILARALRLSIKKTVEYIKSGILTEEDAADLIKKQGGKA